MGCGRNKLEVPSPNDWVGGRYNTASVFPRQVRGRVRDKVLDFMAVSVCMGAKSPRDDQRSRSATRKAKEYEVMSKVLDPN